MKRRTPQFTIIWLGITVLILAGPAAALDLVGTVTDASTAAPLSGCTVVIYELALSTVTDGGGNYSFLSIPDGSYRLMVGKDNYRPIMVLPNGCCLPPTVGDINSSGGIDISDIQVLIDNQFLTLTPLVCETEADIDLNGGVDITDLSLLIDNQFLSLTPLPGCP